MKWRKNDIKYGHQIYLKRISIYTVYASVKFDKFKRERRSFERNIDVYIYKTANIDIFKENKERKNG